MLESIEPQEIPTDVSFDERACLTVNPDIAALRAHKLAALAPLAPLLSRRPARVEDADALNFIPAEARLEPAAAPLVFARKAPR